MDLYNFYHIYADGKWKVAVEEYMRMLKSSELSKHLTGLYIGIVGTTSNRDLVKAYLKTLELDYTIVAEKNTGWEQVTLEVLYEFSQTHDGCILYGHTKGAFNSSPINISWREYMVYNNVSCWRLMVEKLETFTAAGCHWLTKEAHPSIPGNHFAGTFWWTTLAYIRTLGPLLYNSRWDAEMWIGYQSNTPEFKAFDANPGWPGFHTFKKQA